MEKTSDELNALKQEYETLNSKLKELNEEELNMVTGGKPPILTIQQGILMGQFAKLETVADLAERTLTTNVENKDK